LFYQRGLPWDEPSVKESSNGKSKKASKADRGEIPKASRTTVDTTRDFLLTTIDLYIMRASLKARLKLCIPERSELGG
jgi:hypothetical protein